MMSRGEKAWGSGALMVLSYVPCTCKEEGSRGHFNRSDAQHTIKQLATYLQRTTAHKWIRDTSKHNRLVSLVSTRFQSESWLVPHEARTALGLVLPVEGCSTECMAT